MYTPLLYSPIAISIKTTLPGENWDRAQRHISIWAAALYNKLEDLLARVAKVPLLPLPLIIIQGHDWNLLMLTRDKWRTVSGRFRSSHAYLLLCSCGQCSSCATTTATCPYILFSRITKPLSSSYQIPLLPFEADSIVPSTSGLKPLLAPPLPFLACTKS